MLNLSSSSSLKKALVLKQYRILSVHSKLSSSLASHTHTSAGFEPTRAQPKSRWKVIAFFGKHVETHTHGRIENEQESATAPFQPQKSCKATSLHAYTSHNRYALSKRARHLTAAKSKPGCIHKQIIGPVPGRRPAKQLHRPGTNCARLAEGQRGSELVLRSIWHAFAEWRFPPPSVVPAARLGVWRSPTPSSFQASQPPPAPHSSEQQSVSCINNN